MSHSAHHGLLCTCPECHRARQPAPSQRYQIYEREDLLYIPVPTSLILHPPDWMPVREPTMAEQMAAGLAKSWRESRWAFEQRTAAQRRAWQAQYEGSWDVSAPGDA